MSTSLGPLSAIPPGSVRRLDVDGRPLCVARCGDDVHVIDDTCTHADVSLSEGELFCDEREIECWKHGSTFSLETGDPQSLPATKPVPVYDARVDGGKVIVSIS